MGRGKYQMHLLLGLWPDGSGNEVLTEHLLRFRIQYQTLDFWNDKLQRYCIPKQYSTSNKSFTLIVSPDMFGFLTDHADGLSSFLTFTKHANQILIWNDVDAFLCLEINRRSVQQIDQLVPNGSVIWFVDAPISDRHWSTKLQNISVQTRPLSHFFRIPSFVPSCYQKNPDCKDFLILTIVKKQAPHRKFLLQTLNQHPELLMNSLIVARRKSNLIAMDWWLPVADLYRNAWFEIVPETWYKHACYVTEKTIKSISTMTPFLILARPYFLKYLKTLGFRTFDHLIDESYDTLFDYRDRAKKIVEQTKYIVNNGAESFYKASYDVLVHNSRRMNELAGNWTNLSNEFLKTALVDLSVSDNSNYLSNSHITIDQLPKYNGSW